MTTKNQENAACLCQGDIGGVRHTVETHGPEGVAAVQTTDGKRVFYDDQFLQVMRLRNRGKG